MVIVTEDNGRYKIPIIAKSAEGQLEFPKSLNFGLVEIGKPIRKEIIFEN